MIADDIKREAAFGVCTLILNGLLEKGLITKPEYTLIMSMSEKRYGSGFIYS
jgi:hypothetical protein